MHTSHNWFWLHFQLDEKVAKVFQAMDLSQRLENGFGLTNLLYLECVI